MHALSHIPKIAKIIEVISFQNTFINLQMSIKFHANDNNQC